MPGTGFKQVFIMLHILSLLLYCQLAIQLQQEFCKKINYEVFHYNLLHFNQLM